MQMQALISLLHGNTSAPPKRPFPLQINHLSQFCMLFFPELGLQIYALLYGSTSTTADLPPIRQTFARFIKHESREGPLSAGLLRVVLEHYPLDDCPSTADNIQPGQTNSCHDADAQVVAAILSGLANDQSDAVDSTQLEAFFSRLPSRLVGDVLVWIDDHYVAENTRTLLAALLNSKNHGLTTTTVRRIAEYVETREKPELRRRVLAALAKLEPYANIDRQSRRTALRAIWQGAQISELEEAFSPAALAARIAKPTSERSVPRTSLRPDFETTLVRRNQERAARVLASAVVALLRTAKPAEAELNNDWTHVLRAEVIQASHKGTRDHAYIAWTMRMLLDKEANHDISWGANKLLDAAVSQTLPSSVTAFAVSHSTGPRFKEFARNYRATLAQNKTVHTIEVTRSIIDRDAKSDPRFEWLNTSFEPECRDSRLCDHLLDAIGTSANQTVPTSARQRLTRALNHPHPQRFELAAIILPELLERSTKPEHRWDIVAAIEDGLYHVDRRKTARAIPASVIDKVKKAFPWTGTRLDPSHAPIQLGQFSKPLKIGPDHMYEQGGDWYRILVRDDLTVTVEGLQPGIEVVFMDKDRSSTSARRNPDDTSTSFDVSLQKGEHALAVRLSPALSKTATLHLSADRKPIPITADPQYRLRPLDRSTDYVVTVPRHSRQLNLPLSLKDGAVLSVRTGPVEDSSNVDTEVRLFDATTNRQLAFDDDGGVSLFSKLTYPTSRKRDVVLRVSARSWRDSRAQRPLHFKLRVVIARNIVEATADKATAPKIHVGEPSFVRVRTHPSWIRLVVPTSGVYRLTHEPPFHPRFLIEEVSDQPVKPVGSDTVAGFLVRWWQTRYFLESTKEYLVEVRGTPGTEVFLAAKKLDVRVLDLAGERAPKTDVPLETNTPAVIRIPVTGAEFEMTAAQGSELGVFYVYGVNERGLEAVVMEVRKGLTPSKVPVLVRSHEGWTRIEWPSVEDLQYRVRIGLNNVDGPISVINGITVDIGHGWAQQGDWVRLGKHEMLKGSANWNPLMEKYVGCIARITTLAGKDSSGSTLAHVDLTYPQEEQRWFWRTRHMQRVTPHTEQPERCLSYSAGSPS